MKALNNKEVLLAHLQFALYMVLLVILSQIAIFTFFKASKAEVAEMKLKSGDSEKIFNEQIAICDDYEEMLKIYRNYDVRNDDVNPENLSRAIVDRKLKMEDRLKELPEKDVQFHRFLLSKLDGFMRTRDSISALKKEEQRRKVDLTRCREDYKIQVIKNNTNTINGTK